MSFPFLNYQTDKLGLSQALEHILSPLCIDHSKFISLPASCYTDLWLAISLSDLVPTGVLPIIGLASVPCLPHHPGLIAQLKTGRLGMIASGLFLFIVLSF